MMEQAAPALQGSGSGLLPPPSPRQHSTPTYSEEVKAALAEFASQTPPTAVPPTLLRVVPDIAQTGLTWYLARRPSSNAHLLQLRVAALEGARDVPPRPGPFARSAPLPAS